MAWLPSSGCLEGMKLENVFSSADNLAPRLNLDVLCRSFVCKGVQLNGSFVSLISAFDRVDTEITAERLIGCNSRLPRSCRIRNPTSAVDHFFFPHDHTVIQPV